MQPSNHKFHHPYQPYDIQLDFMQKLYQCIENGNVAILESPTGTGKSLSLICAALTWLRDDENRRLFGNDKDEDESLDWLEVAEQTAQKQQLAETRLEIENKLAAIREETSRREVSSGRPVKKVKIKDELEEDDLVLDEYVSDAEIKNERGEQVLSAATLALLEQFAPTKPTDDGELLELTTKMIFCSRTHSQLSQIIDELRKVDLRPISGEATGEDADSMRAQPTIKHVPLSSRRQLCIHPTTSRLSTAQAINDRCLDLQRPSVPKHRKCEFLPNPNDREDKLRLQTFADHAIASIQDIEDLANLGRRMKICPYYAGRAAIQPAEVVTLPYPLLLQKNAREALGVEVKDNIIIIDEAHNLMGAVADTLSVSVPLSHLRLAEKQLMVYCQKFKNRLKGRNRVYVAQIIRLLKSIIAKVENYKQNNSGVDVSLVANDLIAGSGTDQIQPHKLAKYIQESKLVYKVEGYAELVQEQTLISQPTANGHDRQSYPRGVLSDFQSLLLALMNPSNEGRFFVTSYTNPPANDLLLRYTLLNPQEHFREIVQSARAVILAGGTMSPMTDYSDQLFSYLDQDRFKTFSFAHIVDKENVFVQPLNKGPSGIAFDFTFKNRKSEVMLLELGKVIEDLCAGTPDGMVAFFPSYDYLKHVVEFWSKKPSPESIMSTISGLRPIFSEKKESNTDELLQSYSAAISSGRGALLLAVVGGKLSEGINFSDALGRVVVCVGLPYPNIRSTEWKAKVDYIEQSKFTKLKQDGLPESTCRFQARAAAQEYTDNATMRAVNQSIGRAIRHKNDYAAIFLVDARYSTPKIQQKLPAWLKDSIRPGVDSWDCTQGDLKLFFQTAARSK